jgi:hypothetical protein
MQPPINEEVIKARDKGLPPAPVEDFGSNFSPEYIANE